MRKTLSGVIIAIVAAAGGALLASWATPVSGQAPATYRAPRAADGHPDLNGIWQANTEANFDLEAHMARPAMALRAGPYGPVPAAAVLALGAVGSVPPGMGVVEGGPIPYKPEKLATKRPYVVLWVFIVAAFITPPDVFSQVLLAVPMLILFEIGLFVARRLARSPRRNDAEGHRPLSDAEMEAEFDKDERENAADAKGGK